MIDAPAEMRAASLEGLDKHIEAIRSLFRYQALALGLMLLAIVIGQHQVRALRIKIEELEKYFASPAVGRLRVSWESDGEGFRGSDEYLKEYVEPALQLTFLQIFVVERRSKTTAERWGAFSRDLNGYAQSIRRLSFPASRGATIDDLDTRDLERYAIYLDFENRVPKWSKDWGEICRFSPVMLRVTEGLSANGSKMEKLVLSSKPQNLWKWGSSQLIARGDSLKDYKTLVEIQQDETEFLDSISLLNSDVHYFATVRGTTNSVPYTFKSQHQAQPDDIRKDLAPMLLRSSVVSLADLRKQLEDDRHQLQHLVEERKIPLFSSGLELPLPLVGWLLPMVNLILLAAAWEHRRQIASIGTRLKLTEDQKQSLVGRWFYDPFAGPMSAIRLTRALKDGISLFGLSIMGIGVAMNAGQYTRRSVVFAVGALTAIASCIAYWIWPIKGVILAAYSEKIEPP